MKSQRLPWKDFLAQRQAVLDSWPTGRDVAAIEEGLRYQRGDPRGQELRQGHEPRPRPPAGPCSSPAPASP